MARISLSREWLQRNLTTITPISAAIILIIVLRTLNPFFLTTHESIVTLVYGMSWFLIAACGLTFVILMGSFDISIPSIIKLSAMLCGVFYSQFGFFAIPLALIVSLIFGFVNGFLLAKFNIPSFMVTLATSFVAEGLAQIISGGYTRILMDPAFWAISITFIPAGFGLPSIFYWAIILWIIGIIITLITPFGRAIYAIGGNIVGAKLAGINIVRNRILVFMLSALYAGISGILYAAQIQGAHMQIGVLDTIPLFASVVVGGTALTGGVGGIHRTLLGVVIIRWLDSGMSMIGIDYNIRMIVFGIVAIIMTIITIERRRIKIMK
ncbi:MAG: ABC transporter permease [Candidatus Methanomethylicia archaeon]